MEKYESKHQQILRSAEQIYTVISRFDNLTPAVQDKVEEWQADENSCSFKVKGFTVNLQIVAKEAPKYVKIQSGEGLRILDSAPQGLGHRHPHAAGAARGTEYDDAYDDRRQAPKSARPNRRSHGQSHERQRDVIPM